MIKSRRRWSLFVPLNEAQCKKRGLDISEKPCISVKGLSMDTVKKFTTKEQRKRNYAE